MNKSENESYLDYDYNDTCDEVQGPELRIHGLSGSLLPAVFLQSAGYVEKENVTEKKITLFPYLNAHFYLRCSEESQLYSFFIRTYGLFVRCD